MLIDVGAQEEQEEERGTLAVRGMLRNLNEENVLSDERYTETYITPRAQVSLQRMTQ